MDLLEMKRSLAVAVVLGSSLLGCSSGDDSGACVSETTVGTPYTYCSDDWEKAECEEWEAQGPHTFHGGETCEDLGYTYYCAKTYTYHMSSANCI